MTNLQSRIKIARSELCVSVEDLASELASKGVKISARTIYSYELGERQPSALYLEALVQHYDISAEWLLGGHGDMFYSKDSSANTPANVDFYNLVFLPLMDLQASAGYGALIEEKAMAKDFIAFAKKWLDGITATSTKHLAMFTVKGDSMKGEINDGDLIMVNEIQKDLVVAGTYVVCIDDQLYVKILQRIPGNKIQVVSKNPNYPPFEVDLASQYFKIVGKVIWSGSKAIS